MSSECLGRLCMSAVTKQFTAKPFERRLEHKFNLVKRDFHLDAININSFSTYM